MFNKVTSNEQKLTLLLAVPFVSKNIQTAAQTIISNNKHLDFQKVYQFAINHEIAGFVYRNSKSVDLFPIELRERLKGFYRKTAMLNMVGIKETLVILKVLYENGISVIPLKGTFASDCLFNDLGVYPSGDIDVLVSPEDLSKTKDILSSKGGYSLVDTISESDLLKNHYHLILLKQMTLEIHWNLVKRYFKVPAAFWWETARPMEWNGIKAMDLSVENNILYNVFRLFDHCFYPLRFFVLLSAIIEKNKNCIDWNLLLHTAESHRMKKLLVFTLIATQDLMGTDIPASISKNRSKKYGLFKYIVFSGIFSGIKRKHLRMMVYTLLLINPVIWSKVFLGRIFPSTGELRLRYNLPPESRKVYLYYLLNPILLLFKSRKK
ncbi:nucleotidyltransferase family protein [uncultured Desulfobacter sp.]|uniref:nucleotidyltransferase domain-containing protein n=1 Tax=uncultured Desulfobacter sp. TaxID=240139 RepID=UPI0037490400